MIRTGILLLVFGLISTFAFGQNEKYSQRLIAYVNELDTAQSIATLSSLSYRFSRLGEIETQDWIPLYYSAYCNMRMGQKSKDASDIEGYFNEGLVFLEKAEGLCDANSELGTLKARIQLYLMGVDHMSYGPTFIGSAKTALEKAIEDDPNNPRAFLVMAYYYMHLPAFVGGSKKKACEFFQKASAVASGTPTDKSQSAYYPHWGYTSIDYYIGKECQ
ncbi:MAG: hypothetical protein R2828_21725 [Saprospiraceae bacterium]